MVSVEYVRESCEMNCEDVQFSSNSTVLLSFLLSAHLYHPIQPFPASLRSSVGSSSFRTFPFFLPSSSPSHLTASLNSSIVSYLPSDCSPWSSDSVWRERILVYAPCDLARLHASIELPYSTLLIYSVYSLLLSLCLCVEEGEDERETRLVGRSLFWLRD